MIVQSAPAGEPRFVITMAQHTALAGQLARAFGNDGFEPVEPREEVVFVVEHHDAGWADLDGQAPLDPKTGLPYNLVETPFELIVGTSAGSPAFNERWHPYCGLLSSMHSWGLYNGRYGLSDRVLLDSLAAANRAAADRMLDGELARQGRLKATLAEAPETAGWIEDAHLLQNYKQLQFFDTLALYFNCAHEAARRPTSFTHVPRSAEEDATVALEPAGKGTYALAPFPFAEDGVELSFSGRYVAPDKDRRRIDLAAVPEARQTVRLVAA